MGKIGHPGVWLRRRITDMVLAARDAAFSGKDPDWSNLLSKLTRAADEATNNVRMEREIKAEDMKLGAYRVRDPSTGEFGPLQFHMTHGNYVVAVASENAAKLFANFVFDTLGDQRCISDVAAEARRLQEAGLGPHSRPPGNQMVEGPLTPVVVKPEHGDSSAFKAPNGWVHNDGRVYLHETYGARAKLLLQSSGVQLWDGSAYLGTFTNLQKAADYAQNTVVKAITEKAFFGDEGSGC